jgi:hypothetical protein
MSEVTEKVITPNVESVKSEVEKSVKVEPKAILVDRKLEPQSAKYKLNLYTDSGTVKPIFSGAVMRDVSRKYGDIMRSVSSNRFMTEDEVCESVWTIERKMRYPTNRTRKQIQEAVQELIDRQIIVTD